LEELLLGYGGGMERERLHFAITNFILLKKIVVDVDKMNDLLQFSLMFPGEG